MYDIRLIDCHVYMADLLSLADLSFGEGYLKASDFLAPESTVWGAFIDAELVAFFATYLSNDNCLSHIQIEGWNVEGEAFIHLKSIAVMPCYRLRGIATALVRESLIYFGSLGTARFVSVLWHDGTSIPAAKLFVNVGFKPLKQLPKFWHQHSIDNRYKCLICGLPPCNCNAVLYGLDVL